MTKMKENRKFKYLDTFFYFFTMYALFPILKVYHQAERAGFKNVPRKGPFIIVANHASYLDPWYLSTLFPIRHFRYLVTNKWFKKNKLWTLLFELYGCVPITPDEMEPSTIKIVLKIVKEGGAAGIFPEGRVCYDGKTQEFNTGAVYIAMRAKVPIVPAAICGSYAMFPRHAKFPRPRKLRIVIGKPIDYSHFDDLKKDSKDIYISETQKIRDWIVDQLRQFEHRK